MSEIFKTGQNQEPLAVRLPDNELLLGKDNFGLPCSIFLNLSGKPTRTSVPPRLPTHRDRETVAFARW